MEFHGRYSEDLLLRMLTQVRPETKAEGIEGVWQTMEAEKTGCFVNVVAALFRRLS